MFSQNDYSHSLIDFPQRQGNHHFPDTFCHYAVNRLELTLILQINSNFDRNHVVMDKLDLKLDSDKYD